MDLYSQFSERVRRNVPTALITVIDGPHVGAMLLLSSGSEPLGSLGDSELDRVVVRDAEGEIEAGRTSVRHYGPQGQTTPEDLADTPTVRVFEILGRGLPLWPVVANARAAGFDFAECITRHDAIEFGIAE